LKPRGDERSPGSARALTFSGRLRHAVRKFTTGVRGEARKAGLIDLHVGDVFTQDKGAFFERRWRVEQIQSAVKYLVNDIVGNYGARFPSEPFFAKGFHFDAEKPSLAYFQPLIASTHGRGQRQSELLNLYQDQCLPLAPVAELAGVLSAGPHYGAVASQCWTTVLRGIP
jgi:hypothetical protein